MQSKFTVSHATFSKYFFIGFETEKFDLKTIGMSSNAALDSFCWHFFLHPGALSSFIFFHRFSMAF